MMRVVCSLAAIVSAVSAQTTTSTPISPCPDVFTYDPPGTSEKAGRGAEKWYGTVTLNTDITLYALWLNVILDNKAEILGNWVGEVTTEDNLNFKIENTKMKLTPDSPTIVRFFIQYSNQGNVPRLHSILFNGREICNINKLQSENQSSVSSVNYNYDKNGIIARTDRTTTTIRPTTTTTRNQYGVAKKTTTKSNFWTQAKSVTTQGTTEKIQTQYETTKNQNNAQLTSAVWGWSQPKNENTQQVKPASNLSKSKEQTQSASGSNTQSKTQWSQSKSETNQQTGSSVSQNQAQSKQEIRQQSTAQVWSQTKPASYQQTKSEKLQATTERNTQVTFASTSNTKPQSWSVGKDNKQSSQSSYVPSQSTTENTYKAQVWSPNIQNVNNEQIKSTNTQTRNDDRYQVSTDSQYYSQANEQNNQQSKPQTGVEYSYVGSSYEVQNTQQRKSTSVANSEQYNVPVQQKVSTDSFQITGNRAQERPVEPDQRRPVQVLPIRDDSIVQVRPIKQTTTTPKSYEINSYTQDQPKRVVGYTDNSRNSNNRDGLYDRNVQNEQLIPAPIHTDYYNAESSKEDEDEESLDFGLPVYIPNLRPEASCGKVIKKPPRVLPYGSTTSEGQWPWQAAIYQQQTVDFKYICGGTLVSRRHIITAAHCVAKRNSRKQVNQNTLTVYLGKFNLRTSVEGVQVKFVNKIIIHPDYNATIFSRDLAILELREAATFNDWVRPACLWPENKIGRRNIVGKKGSVVGWGFEMSGAPKAELSLLEMPVVDQETCIASFADFYEKFTSQYTYCAGYNDGTSLCNGDSGGGMVFKRGSTWYLRGLASISVARPNQRCDPNRYVIFTDLAKFLPWIEENVD